jgi:iron complex transport system substrate-binding protein
LLVGVTRFDDYPPSLRALPKVGGFTDPSLEAIVALRPDLVLLNPNEANQSLTEALGHAHVRWLALADGALADFAPMVRALAEALDARAQGEALVATFTRDLTALRAHAVAGRALVIFGHRPLVAAGAGSFGAELMQAAGITNAYTGAQRYPHLDLETVLQLAPDWLIDLDMNQDGHSDKEFFTPLAPSLAARHIRVVYRADAALLRLGPRLPKAMAALTAELR